MTGGGVRGGTGPVTTSSLDQSLQLKPSSFTHAAAPQDLSLHLKSGLFSVRLLFRLSQTGPPQTLHSGTSAACA